jgi:carbamoyltransferase
MNVLGLNAYHGDASATLLSARGIECAVEEERFSRLKHQAGFPALASVEALKYAGLEARDLTHVAISRDPSAHIHRKLMFALSQGPRFSLIRDRLANVSRVRDPKPALAEALDVCQSALPATMHRVEHHQAHMASSFFVSPFDQAALLSIDGFGDFVSTMWGVGRGSKIQIEDWVEFPHSMGILYTAITQYLGFPKYGDEFKVMGLAPLGEPEYLDRLRPLVKRKGMSFALDLDYFVHHSEGVNMTWEAGSPTLGPVFSPELETLLGPKRDSAEPLDTRHRNIAASLQALLEEVVLDLLRGLAEKTKMKTLCMAGGVALNCTLNGKITRETPFEQIYIQPAAYDAGTSLGAALYVRHHVLDQPRDVVMDHVYWGLEYSPTECRAALEKSGLEFRELIDPDELALETAKLLAQGHILGWFQGRFEWGPRALGNRSINCDPRNPRMKDILNHRIKHRESFRPFAPSVTAESASDYFELDQPSPFMLITCQVRQDKRALIPAVTHSDGSARVQTVTREANPRYWALLKAFERVTGVPVLLNTSFNENEPIVNTPEEAVSCFLRNDMDLLVLGPYLVVHRPGDVAHA